MPMPQVRELFLRFVHPWEPPHDQLWKCITTIVDGSTYPPSNHAAQSIDDLSRLIDFRMRWTRPNIYTALATFKAVDTTNTSKDGFPKLQRKKQNVVSLSSLFVDIDTGKSNGYQTTAEAEIGLDKFLEDSGMPEPTMIVRSGSGGMHVYWCTAEPMPLAVWEPLALALKTCAEKHGFLIDPVVTADAARILRVPGTFNYKSGQPVPVTMDQPTAIRQYVVAHLAKVLAPYVGMQRTSTGTGPSVAGVNVGSAWHQNFQANVNEQALPKLPIDQIAVQCPATTATLIDGGAGHSEPLWSQFMFLSAWTTDPVDAAHRLSKGYHHYDPALTDKKLAEKQQAIASGNLGWPKCASFGHPACKTCSLLQFGKSPIHFAHQYAQQQPVQARANDNLMPDGYYRDASNDHVRTSTEKYGHVDVLGYPILDGGMGFVDGQQMLVVKTIVSVKERWGSVSLAKQTPQGICEALTKGVDIVIRGNAERQAIVRDFIMAWVQHLQKASTNIQPTNFGWSGDKFIYGGEAFTPTGRVSAFRSAPKDYNYKRVGSDTPWRDAIKQLVYGRPHLESVVATAFAAPLIKMVCDSSPVFSIFSHGSGFGKSTAMKLAQAVYAHPIESMSMLGDTLNAVQDKITTLSNLPVYWDELKTEKDIDDMVRLVFQTTQGRGKARLSRDSTPMAIGTSKTMLTVASNHGILNHVVRATAGTSAGGVRVFEMEAEPLVSSIPTSQGDYLLMALDGNYGVIGSLYIDFIVQHRQAIDAYIKGLRQELQSSCGFSIEERLREATMAAIMAGAALANQAGLTAFDVPAIERCLRRTLSVMRSSATAKIYAMTSPQAGEEFLTDLLNDLRGQLEMITTDTVPVPVMGRPPVGPPVTAHNIDPQRMRNVWLQHGRTDGRILMRVMPFDQWCAKRKQNPQQMLDLLRVDYDVVQRKGTIGVGIGWLPSTRSQCWDLTPKVAPPPPAASHTPSSPSSNFGSP